MIPPEYVELITRHQVLLEGLKTGYVRDFLTVFGALDDIVAQSLASLKVNRLNEVSRSVLEKVLTSTAEKQAVLFDAQIEKYVSKLPQLAKYEAEFESRALRSVLPKKIEKGIKLPRAEKVFQEAAARPIQATGEAVKPYVQNWSRAAIQKTNKAVRLGYQNGKTVPQMINELGGTKALKYKDGLTAVTKREAATVIRTSTQHVAMTARAVVMEENDDIVMGYIIIATLDGKTSTLCRSLDKKKFKHGKGPVPPLHPNCRSATAPDMAPEFDFLDAGATRASKDGPVDADLSYHDWLKKQTPAFQDQVLGPVRGKLFRDGGLDPKRFSDLQLDKNFEPLTLDEMRKLEPLAFEKAGI